MGKDRNIIREKSYRFALDIIKLCKMLNDEKEFVLSRQLVRSGTSIGANIEEAQGAVSKKEFLQKISISFKEAKETNYWLRLLRDSGLVAKDKSQSLISDSNEIIKILSSISKTTRENIHKSGKS
jgi:four helix bundle protein